MTASPVRIRTLLIVLLAPLLIGPTLSGCSNFRSAIGLGKTTPDEFAVLARAPLSVPPNFGLRPPAPGVERPQEPSTRDGARGLLVNTPETGSDDGDSTAAAAFKRQLGADQADPEIRTLINSESGTFIYEDEHLIDRLLFWNKKKAEDAVVDATKEQQRLQENAALGKPVTEGETPVIKRKKGGLFDKLF